MSQRCENCRFSINGKPEWEHGNYICVRYPPIPVSFVNDQKPPDLGGARMITARGSFLPVNHNWWCGEWQGRRWADRFSAFMWGRE